jgi:creatinine amidohydrolase
VPLAATEQHGPHLTVYTDSFVCEHVVSQAVLKASQSVPILMAPMLSIGCSDHHLHLGGTISFSSSTYLQILHDIGESLVNCGFRKIIFINGHGGNELLMTQTAHDLTARHPIWTACASWWNIADSALEAIHAEKVSHAGVFETSTIMALRPELVREEQIRTTHTQTPMTREWAGPKPRGTFVGKLVELTGYDGYSEPVYKATADKGNLYLETIVDSVSEWLVNVCRAINKDEQN